MPIALVGNQNTGKTTLFNKLTGGRLRTGNFPGVTVDAAFSEIKGTDVKLVDLPGLYSLSATSEEEALSRDFIFNASPELIINIIDATNLNRNLYLTLQLLETGLPVVLAVNMYDEVIKNGAKLDITKLSEMLGVPAFPVSALKGTGLDGLIKSVTAPVKKSGGKDLERLYGGAKLLRYINETAKELKDDAFNCGFLAVKLTEDEPILPLSAEKTEKIENILKRAEKDLGKDRQTLTVEMRYDAIEKITKAVVLEKGENAAAARSVKIDRILTHKIFAFPIFFAVMALVFYITFGFFGKFLCSLTERLVGYAVSEAENALTRSGVSPAVVSFVTDGIMAGIGSVLTFLPTIIILFFLLSIIEDSGYMARVSFVMDKFLSRLGLNGKAVVPLLIGFGCSVPAYISARTLTSERDKRFVSVLVPFVSCSAKIPVYALFSSVFFPKHAALVMLFLYFFGIALGIVIALLCKNTVFKGGGSMYVMELPPYRMPSLKTTGAYLYEKAKDFLTRAFTVIFLASVAIFFFRSFGADFKPVGDSADSLLCLFAKALEPIFRPLGFGDWRAVSAVITGITAKEAILSTFAVLFGKNGLEASLSALFTPSAALSFLIFCSLYMPCVAAFAALRKETSLKFAVAAMAAQTAAAYSVSLIFYTLTLLFGF